MSVFCTCAAVVSLSLPKVYWDTLTKVVTLSVGLWTWMKAMQPYYGCLLVLVTTRRRVTEGLVLRLSIQSRRRRWNTSFVEVFNQRHNPLRG